MTTIEAEAPVALCANSACRQPLVQRPDEHITTFVKRKYCCVRCNSVESAKRSPHRAEVALSRRQRAKLVQCPAREKGLGHYRLPAGRVGKADIFRCIHCGDDLLCPVPEF